MKTIFLCLLFIISGCISYSDPERFESPTDHDFIDLTDTEQTMSYDAVAAKRNREYQNNTDAVSAEKEKGYFKSDTKRSCKGIRLGSSKGEGASRKSSEPIIQLFETCDEEYSYNAKMTLLCTGQNMLIPVKLKRTKVYWRAAGKSGVAHSNYYGELFLNFTSDKMVNLKSNLLLSLNENFDNTAIAGEEVVFSPTTSCFVVEKSASSFSNTAQRNP